MTHADSLAIPAEVTTKPALYAHITETLGHLLAPGGNDWITALANSSALLYGSFENYKLWGKKAGKRVNWAGACCPRLRRRCWRGADRTSLQASTWSPHCSLSRLSHSRPPHPQKRCSWARSKVRHRRPEKSPESRAHVVDVPSALPRSTSLPQHPPSVFPPTRRLRLGVCCQGERGRPRRRASVCQRSER